jgi:mannose-6-phosphate isomerase-like protein (cupin superfamily)
MADDQSRRVARIGASVARSLSSTYVHLPDETRASLVPVSDTFWDELGSGDRPLLERGRLVTQFDFSSDWPNWERHPFGDELVVLLSGSAELLLDLPSGTSRTRLKAPGEFVLVPRDTWHTAHTREACSMLFITHGPGTEHREVSS